jgi:hypothetical protein
MGLTTRKRQKLELTTTTASGAAEGQGVISFHGADGLTALGYPGENMHHQVFVRAGSGGGAVDAEDFPGETDGSTATTLNWNLQVSADGTNFFDLFDASAPPPVVFQTGATNNPPYPFTRLRCDGGTKSATQNITIDIVSYGTEIR